MAGYVRVESANIVNGNTIQASHFNNEYNALQAAFSASTGHSHGGSAGEGAPITGLSGATINAGTISGATISGATINGGTISGATISGATINGGTISGATISGATINAGTISGATINGGTISGTTISASNINGGIQSGVSIRSPSGVDIYGKKTIWVPAVAISPMNTSGCAALNTITTHASAADTSVLAFDASAEENAQFVVAFPKSWNAGTVSAKAYWLYLSGSNNGVVWTFAATSHGSGETISGTTWGTPVSVTASAVTAGLLHVAAESAAITIAGSPSSEDLIYFRVARTAANAGDSLTGDADLLGVKLYFTTNAGDDT